MEAVERHSNGEERCISRLVVVCARLWLTASIIFLLSVCQAAEETRGVRIGLHASWIDTPLSLEAATYLRDTQTTDSAWAFIDLLAENAAKFPTEKAEYDAIHKALSVALDSKPKLAIAEWALASRIASPRVHAQRAENANILKYFRKKEEPDVFAILTNDDKVQFINTLEDLKGDLFPEEELAALGDGKMGSEKLVGRNEAFVKDCGNSNGCLTVILYGDVLSEQGAKWHFTIKQQMLKRNIRYVYKYFYRQRNGRYPGLQGWRAVAKVKSTEYVAQDDVAFAKLFPEAPFEAADKSAIEPPISAIDALGDESSTARNGTFCEPVMSLEALCERKHLQFAAAKYIVGEETTGVLDRLTHVSASLVPLTEAYRQSHYDLDNESGFKDIEASVDRLSTLPGLAEGLYISGRFFSGSDAFKQLKSTISCISSILRNSELGPPPLRTEVRFSVPEKVISWLNNVETDKHYRKLAKPDSDEGRKKITEFLNAPEASRRLLSIRSNFLQLVFVLDLGSVADLEMFDMAFRLSSQPLPIRIGIVPVNILQESNSLVAGYHHFARVKGSLRDALSFLQMTKRVTDYFAMGQSNVVSHELAEMAFAEVAGGGDDEGQSLDAISENAEVGERIAEVREWADSSGLLRSPTGDMKGLIILNGKVMKSLDGVMTVAIAEQERMARNILSKSNVNEGLYRLPTYYPNLADDKNHGTMSIRESGLESLITNLEYAYFDGRHSADSRAGMDVQNDLDSSGARCLDDRNSVVNDNSVAGVDMDSKMPNKDNCATENHPEYHLKNFGESAKAQDLADGSKMLTTNAVTLWLVGGEQSEMYKNGKKLLDDLRAHTDIENFFVRVATVPSGHPLGKACQSDGTMEEKAGDSLSFAIVNGRCISMREVESIAELAFVLHYYAFQIERTTVESDDALLDRSLASSVASSDIDGACKYTKDVTEDTQALGVEKIKNHMITGSLDKSSDGTVEMSSPLLIRLPHGKQPLVNLFAVLNPLGDYAHPISRVLSTLRIMLMARVNVEVLLVPLPLTADQCKEVAHRYEHAVVQNKIIHEEATGLRQSPFALMAEIPQCSLLTFFVDTPRAWFITLLSSNYDLDNIFLEQIPVRVVHAEYELQSLLVEGSALDAGTSGPTQGLQMELTSGFSERYAGTSSPHKGRLSDTIVMANLGYWQLRAQPGSWKLQLAEGRSRDVYAFDEILRAKDGFQLNSEKSHVEFKLDSLDGVRQIALRAKRRKGKENIPLLASNGSLGKSPTGNMKDAFSSVYRKVVSGGDVQTATGGSDTEEKLHVFTVVSGHLYERFLKIMMLSVTKHSSLPVKFWLLENHLSPNFKTILPKFAAMHGFTYAFVTYKWPFFLREQKSKQREIWAYKILFLDVLFPLDLHRVIYVDADQVANKDLSPLMSLDLRGAPYAFTPFCNSRDDMKGYRFWEQGFWKDTLKEASYKISALYVVDLKRFREISAGDTLRFLYQKLSADPNSLSNLDQDLPNYASAVSLGNIPPVEIFELPRSTLWCESWCHERDKESAIMWDLCNNPMTKEPKLKSARRIIPGWDEYDQIATITTDKIHEEILDEEMSERDGTEVDSEADVKDEL